MPTIFCPHCGMTNRAGSNFCNRCGTALQEPTDAPSSEQVEEKDRQRDGMAANSRKGSDEQPLLVERTSTTPPPSSIESQSIDDLGKLSESQESNLFISQPWLQNDDITKLDDEKAFDVLAAADADQATQEPSVEAFDEQGDEDDAQNDPPSSRLITGIQGLLDPLGLSREASLEVNKDDGKAASREIDTLPLEDAIFPESELFPGAALGTASPMVASYRAPHVMPHTMSPKTEIDDQQLRQIRRLMAEEPLLKEAHLQTGPPTYPSLRIPWIFWLVGLSLALPVLWGLNFPVGIPQEWPGVVNAYQEVQSLSESDTVLLFWAYDPTTAGELDRVAYPVMRHLIERRSQLIVVSLLPNGPATAQRLLNRVVKDVYQGDGRIPQGNQPTIINGGFLPGGTAVLPLLGQDIRAGLSTKREALSEILSPTEQPTLAIVIASQAEDVQHWLEQVQPLNRASVVALVSAGADPILRPYLDSGQLRGLVSGFDGASAYVNRMEQPLSQEERQTLQAQIVSLNWGLGALLAIIIVGNLKRLIRKRQ